MLAKPGVDGWICACTWDAAASLPVVHVRGDGGDDGGGLGDAPILLDAPGYGYGLELGARGACGDRVLG